MGSSSSKVARGGAVRKFPSKTPASDVTKASSRVRSEPQPQSDGSKDQAVRADATDPDSVSGDFSKRLHQMGIAQPNPTFSPSSTASPRPAEPMPAAPAAPIFPSAKNNTTLSVLQARDELQRRADQDLESMGQAGAPGRRFVDMRTLVDALQLVRNGHKASDVEKRFGLETNLLSKLGRPGILSHVSLGN